VANAFPSKVLSGMCSPHKGQLTAAGLYKIFTRFPFHRRQANLLRCKDSEKFAQKTNLFGFFRQKQKKHRPPFRALRLKMIGGDKHKKP